MKLKLCSESYRFSTNSNFLLIKLPNNLINKVSKYTITKNKNYHI